MGSAMTTGNGHRNNPYRPWIWGGAACLLSLPAVAMYFGVDGVAWGAADFVAMGLMLAIACGLFELGAWLSGNTAYRLGFGLATLAGFLTVWANLAVGMLGDEDNGANLMFVGVLAIAAAGAVLARFRAAGMVRVMSVTAVAQLAAAATGLAMGFGPLEVFLTACFAVPWLASAWLFRAAA